MPALSDRGSTNVINMTTGA
ncbi:hypothetical protein EYZ11_012779 [Aspergillus tanneri]|uniref:Uncharacterized protein n=1 Tax=Aspergillus tanneri TaxID=1220188 RepID=A0A4S3J1I0_9EURO|nr:hypothetical protein EYZ11_012779 [Aspergillus tanneri]